MRTTAVSTATTLHAEQLGSRVLVIAPHPDDEVLAAGGTIHRLLESGARVRVVVATAGDSYRRAAARVAGRTADAASYLELGQVRHQECLKAICRIGLTPEDVVSLGYADGTLAAMWDQRWDVSRSARGRNGVSKVPYSWAARPGADMCGQNLAADLEDVIAAFDPDTIIAPDAYETHADHSALAAFSTYAMDTTGFTGRRLSAVVHFRHYPYPWAHLPGTSLNPPPQLVAADTEWLAVPVSPDDNRAKSAAIAEYRSQTAIADLALYMRAFIRTNELFASRRPARVGSRDTDERPRNAAASTICVTPPPVIPATPGSNRPRIARLSMTRGPSTLWIGIHCDGPVAPGDTFRLGLRLFGSPEAPGRLDVSARGTVATALGQTEDSTVPQGISAMIERDTMWISVPVEAIDGRTRCMIGAMVARGAGTGMRTAWREADLQDRA